MLIRAGTKVELNIYASHHNPEFFPNPEKFLPDRFLKDNAKNIIPYTYRPFGGESISTFSML
jgi:cytochrome P450 family 6